MFLATRAMVARISSRRVFVGYAEEGCERAEPGMGGGIQQTEVKGVGVFIEKLLLGCSLIWDPRAGGLTSTEQECWLLVELLSPDLPSG